MIRLFTLSDLGIGKILSLTPAHHHYLAHVMRQKPGDSMLFFNGRDGEWIGHIQTLNKHDGTVCLTRQTRPQPALERLILCPALIKKENFDLVLQKATELGVSDIYPLQTQRTVIGKLNATRTDLIVREAAEQCERLTVPTVHTPATPAHVLTALSPETIPVFLTERGHTTAPLTAGQTYAFFVGPEGGWTPDELTVFQRAGQGIFWHLGDTILRAETAALAALACCRFAFTGKTSV